jgi:hypothetical protein
MAAKNSASDPLDPPRSNLARAALAYVEQALSTNYLRHSLRTYGCARAYARKRDLSFDEEGLYVAALFHDLGLFPPFRDRSQPFQVVSSNHMRAFLQTHKVDDERSCRLMTAIDYHMQPLTPWRKGTEAGLLHVGAWADALYYRRWGIRKEASALDAALPRGFFLCEATAQVFKTLGSPAAMLGLWLPDMVRAKA